MRKAQVVCVRNFANGGRRRRACSSVCEWVEGRTASPLLAVELAASARDRMLRGDERDAVLVLGFEEKRVVGEAAVQGSFPNSMSSSAGVVRLWAETREGGG